MKKELVLAALNNYKPFDETEKDHLMEMLNLCDNPEDVISRNNSLGHFTVSAIVIDSHYRNILMIWHQKLNRWLQPGGHIEEFDRTITDAVIRELLEETGIEVNSVELQSELPFDIDVHLIPERKGIKEHSHFDLRYFFIFRNRKNISDLYKWVPLKEILRTGDPSLCRFVNKVLLAGSRETAAL